MQAFDESILRLLRQADDPGRLIFGDWAVEPVRAISALGGWLFLALVTVVAVAMLGRQRRGLAAWTVLLTNVGGWSLERLTKWLIGRPRPTVVPRLEEVASPSFPSGHAMLAMIVYLAMGLALAGMTTSRRWKAGFILGAILLAIVIGLTRVVLGVHYPSDVLAGWALGAAWTLTIWRIVRPGRQGSGA